MRSPELGTMVWIFPGRGPRALRRYAVASSTVLQQAEHNSHQAETRQGDKDRVECRDPPDLITVYDVDPYGQDQTTKAGHRRRLAAGHLVGRPSPASLSR